MHQCCNLVPLLRYSWTPWGSCKPGQGPRTGDHHPVIGAEPRGLVSAALLGEYRLRVHADDREPNRAGLTEAAGHPRQLVSLWLSIPLLLMRDAFRPCTCRPGGRCVCGGLLHEKKTQTPVCVMTADRYITSSSPEPLARCYK